MWVTNVDFGRNKLKELREGIQKRKEQKEQRTAAVVSSRHKPYQPDINADEVQAYEESLARVRLRSVLGGCF